MPRPLRWGILGTSTIILFKDIDKYAFMCGSVFYESDVRLYSVGKYYSTPANVCWHWPWKSDKPFNINQFLLSSTIFFSRHCFFRRLHHYFQFFILVYKVLFQFPVMIPSTFIVQGGQITCLFHDFDWIHFLNVVLS